MHALSFKYKNLHIAALMFEQGEYLFKFDLKSVYHLWPEHYKYLGLCWDFDGVTNYCVFKVLFFGLFTACYLFTKLMRPIVNGRGLKAIIYLDDGIIAVKGKTEAIAESTKVKQDLELAGHIINIGKCLGTYQSIEWLSFYTDLAIGKFSIPAQKIAALKAKLSEAKQKRLFPAKQLVSIIGKITSMSATLGSVTRLMTCSLYTMLNSRVAWCCLVDLTDEVLQEIEFWLMEISKFNG